MKILLIAPQPFFQDRGTPIAVRMMAETLVRLGHTVHLLVYHEGRDIVLENVELHRSMNLPWVKGIKAGLTLKKLFCDIFIFIKCLQLMHCNRFDLIHAVEESVFMARILKLFVGKPYVYDMDSSLPQQITDKFPQLSFLRLPMEFLEKNAIRGSVGVVAVCKVLEEIAIGYSPDTPVLRLEDITLLDCSGIGQENLREKYRFSGPVVMYVGNLEKYQGIDLLLRSFAIVVRKTPDTHLLLIGGSDDDIAFYRGRVLELDLAGRVTLCGPRPVTLLGYYLDQADILVSPRTQGNNTPMKIYSYLDTGKPVLATRLSTHTQVLDDEISYLVRPEPGAMADGIMRLLYDIELCRRLGQNSRDRVAAEFSPAAYRKKLTRFYKTIAVKIHGAEG